MVSSTRQAIACILVIFSVAVFACAQNVQTKEQTSTITGKVTIKGKAAPGIFIGLRRQESSYYKQITGLRAVTDSEGRYQIENVTAGTYVVIPVAPAYISDENNSERILNVNKGETIENIDFVLVRGGAITGKVVDADGGPLIEQEVVAIPESQNTHRYMRYLGARTDDRGIYRMFGLPKGRYRVAAGSDNFASFQRTSYKRIYYPGVEDQAQAALVDVSESSEAINIDLTLGGTINSYTAYGRIIDGQTGQPMPNVNYGLTRYYDENSSSSTNYAVPSNSRGEFRLENLSPGKYGVSAQDRPNGNWRAEEERFEVIDRDVTGLVIRTEKAGSISGVIVLEGADDKSAREQLARAHVGSSITNESTGRGAGSSANPAPDGSFRITGLASGTATLGVFSSIAQFRIARVELNGVLQPRGIEIKPGEQITGVKVVVNYGNATIRGSVVVQNGAVPTGARIFVWLRKTNEDPYASGSMINATPQLDARGQFVVENMFPGTYEIHAGLAVPDAGQHMFYKKQDVVVTAGSNNVVNITLDLSSPTTRP
jgi:5-hydroxyisourate hydrolase-like protein (transthyretin family)